MSHWLYRMYLFLEGTSFAQFKKPFNMDGKMLEQHTKKAFTVLYGIYICRVTLWVLLEIPYILESIWQTKQTYSKKKDGTTLMMFSGLIFHCDFSLIA